MCDSRRRAAVERAAAIIGGGAEMDRPLGELTTYRVGGRAALFFEPSCRADLARAGEAVCSTGIPVLVLGKGSNLLVSDAGFSGLCIRLGEEFAQVELGAGGGLVSAGGAAAYPVLARRTAAAGLTGMEWAVGVPGSVGGAVRMNAGGHGSETSDRLVSCTLVSFDADAEGGPGGGGHGDGGHGVGRVVPAADLELSYRRSSVRAGDIVIEASFQLDQGDAAASSARIAEIVRWRREHQPGGQNAGSVFTNPPGDAAGRLVEAAGLKGFRLGTAAVSEKHANFIQADPGGSAEDVKRLIDEIKARVAGSLGVELQTELKLVGFEEAQ